ncbi:hypothetical protein Nepgr_024890 [Nepenthes gracilis]|uniref:Retrovirus-related Pol polyprotein from transposon TNT 1-94 n=1 Tax=Nepenthes gracilis TaxID=150966 RepID=A0AAD3T5E0_NEPGR|nr:hypothetical protein Nepgr_024890 [Nepenthes gracilis]
MSKIPYSSTIGSLMYTAVCTQPDIARAVGLVSRFLSNPGMEHWSAVKWIFRYLHGTSKMGLHFGGEKLQLVRYTDADMAGDVDSRKSTSGYLIKYAGGTVSWQFKLQKCVALSTTKAELQKQTREGSVNVLFQRSVRVQIAFKQPKETNQISRGSEAEREKGIEERGFIVSSKPFRPPAIAEGESSDGAMDLFFSVLA